MRSSNLYFSSVCYVVFAFVAGFFSDNEALTMGLFILASVYLWKAIDLDREESSQLPQPKGRGL